MKLAKLDDTGSWAINKNPIYIPFNGGATVERQNILSSATGTTEDGTKHVDYVRIGLRKVSLIYNSMTGTELKKLLDIAQLEDMELTFKDAGAVQKMKAYCTGISYVFYKSVKDEDIYKDVSVTFEEV